MSSDSLPDPTETMIAAGAHALSEWLDDEAPLHERRYRDPAKAAWKAMLALATAEARADSAVPSSHVSAWISVDERMPVGDVLLCTTSRVCIIGDWYIDGWRTHRSAWEGQKLVHAYRLEDITHWMPLPEPPQRAAASPISTASAPANSEADHPKADFDAWSANPHTKVLHESIARDYVPKAKESILREALARLVAIWDRQQNALCDGREYRQAGRELGEALEAARSALAGMPK